MPTNKIHVVHSSDAPSNVVTVKTTKTIIRKVPKGKGEAFVAANAPTNNNNEKRASIQNSEMLKNLGVVKENMKVTQLTKVTKTTTIRRHRLSESKLTNWAAVVDSQRMFHEKNRKQATSGQAVAIELSEKPLSQIWNRLNRIIPQLLFGFNLLLSVIDLIMEPEYLFYKIPTFTISVIENVILACTWFFKNTSVYTKSSEQRKKNLDKQFQYLENIIQEVLMYPSIICTLFGVVVGKSYMGQDPLAELELVLLSFDVITLAYIYAVRVYMVRKIMITLRKQAGANTSCDLWHVTTRFSTIMLFNSLLFGVLLGMLAMQIHSENDVTEDYTCSGWTWIMIAGTLLLPLSGLALFIVVNYFWFLEMLVLINLNVAMANDEILQTAEDVEAPVVKTVLEYSLQNTDATKERLEDIQTVSSSQKYFYALGEWKICLVMSLFTGFACLYAVAFNSSFYAYGQAMRASCIVFIAICNYHVATLSVAMVAYIIAILVSGLAYKCGMYDKYKDADLPTTDNNNDNLFASYRKPPTLPTVA